MLLLIDIGNTNITLGFSRGGDIFGCWDISTKTVGKLLQVKKSLLLNLRKNKLNPETVRAVVICSVVPQAEIVLRRIMPNFFLNAQVLVLGKELPPAIKIKYKNSRQLGTDRMANAIGVCGFYKLPALVIDFGTAITIDAVSKKGEYLGGVIIPGLQMSLTGLHDKTALLPLLSLKSYNYRKTKKIIGTDTQSSIYSGVIYGYSFLIDGLIQALIRELKSNPKVIATGGNLEIFKLLCKNIDIYDQSLTLKGLEIAYNNAKLINKSLKSPLGS